MRLGPFEVGADRPFFLIAGPCVVESEALVMEVAGRLRDMTAALGIPFIFKASFDKANRSSASSFRGHGLEAGLKALARVRREIGVPVLTDVHEDTPLSEVSAVVDVLQTPAFLCRQTNFILGVAPRAEAGEHQEGTFLCAVGDAERGRQGALHRQPADHGVRARILVRLQQSGVGHALARDHARNRVPGGVRRHALGAIAGRKGRSSGGQREFVPVLARAAVAAGVAGLFMETHPDPAKALSDGPNAWPLDRMSSLLTTLKDLDLAVKRKPFEESLI